MFGKLFGRKKETESVPSLPEPMSEEQQRAALLEAAIEKQRQTDPLVHLRIGAKELVQRLLNGMQSERGVHIESLLTMLGSLAGFCCIDSTLKQIAAVGKTTRECGIIDVETSDGSRYYFGDPVNELLMEGKHSLWALIAGMINHLGSQDYPDAGEIAGHVAGSVGTEAFGIPRWPNENQAGDLPINYVRDLWPAITPLLERFSRSPYERPMLFGFAVQNVIEMGKDVIPPSIAGKLVMESAVPMAKLDPAALWPETSPA